MSCKCSHSVYSSIHTLFVLSVLIILTNATGHGDNDNHHHSRPRFLRRRGQAVLLNGFPSERIINGTVVQDTERYPYAAALFQLDQRTDFRCGGVLIAPDIVITAAHCSGEYNFVEVNRFNINFRSVTEYERFVIDKVVDHPFSFKERDDVSPRRFDVALIKVHGYSHTAPPIRIAGMGPDNALPELVVGQPLTVFGWGLTSPPSATFPALSSELREVDLNYVPNDQCRQATGRILDSNGTVLEDYTYDGRIFDEMMCMATPFKDSCLSDSGGPLLLNGGTPQADLLMGVVSFGIGCANPIFPGVYTRLSEMTDWIQENVCQMTEYETPADFGCTQPKSPLAPIFPPSSTSVVQQEGGIDITLEIQLDFAAFETGWLLQSVTTGIVYRYAPIFTYEQATDQFLLFETIRGLPAQDDYVLRILDAGGGGLGQFTEGYFTIYQGVVVNDATAEADGAMVLVHQAAKGRWTEFSSNTRQHTFDVFFTPMAPDSGEEEEEEEAEEKQEEDCQPEGDDEVQAEFRVYLSNPAGKKRNCEWLAASNAPKRAYYCDTFPKTQALCPVTCGTCEDEDCQDDNNGVFPFHPRTTRTCGWLQSSVSATRREQYCSQGAQYFPGSVQRAPDACPLTCSVRAKCNP